MSGTTWPSSARAASIKARLASRRKAARFPSLAARAESKPQPLRLAGVKSSGQNKRRSRRWSQWPTKADLPTPLGPARSMTLRSVAVWSSKLRARWFCGVSSQASAESSPNGTAVAPHWRARSESSRLGAFFISVAALDLTVEMRINPLGQAEGGAPVGDFDTVEFEGIKTQLHAQGAQAQVHFVAIRIVSGIFVFAMRGCCEGQEDADPSPTTAARLQLESAAQQLGPLAHAGQPEMALDRPLPDVEAGTFVAHLGHERAIGRLGDPDLDARSAAMACGVGQGLEEDAVQGDLRGERRPIGNPGHVHGCVQAGSALVFGHSPPHYLGRRRSLQLGRTKPRGDGPHVAEGVGERSAYAGE